MDTSLLELERSLRLRALRSRLRAFCTSGTRKSLTLVVESLNFSSKLRDLQTKHELPNLLLGR